MPVDPPLPADRKPAPPAKFDTFVWLLNNNDPVSKFLTNENLWIGLRDGGLAVANAAASVAVWEMSAPAIISAGGRLLLRTSAGTALVAATDAVATSVEGAVGPKMAALVAAIASTVPGGQAVVESAATLPSLVPAPGYQMLGQVLQILEAAPAAERARLAAALLPQIPRLALGGAWEASEVAAAHGARVWSGEYHSLVIDASGNVFKGPNSGLQFGSVNGGFGVVGWAGLKKVF